MFRLVICSSWGLFCPYVVCVVFIARVLRRDLQSNSLTWSALQAYSDSQSHPVAARQAGRVIGPTDLYSNDLYERRLFWGGEHSRTRPYLILLDPEKAIEFFLHGDGFQMFSSWDSQHQLRHQQFSASFSPFGDARVSRAALSREMHRVMLSPQLGFNRSVWVLHSFWVNYNDLTVLPH